jgi:CRP-like cAMP-binding protein
MKTRRKSPVDIEPTATHLCSANLRLKLIGGLPFFAGLSRRDLEEINGAFVELGYPRDQFIYCAGDEALRWYVVAKGVVRLFQTAPTGQNVLLSVLARGDFFGSLAVQEIAGYVDTAQAMTATCALSIRSSDFRRILDQHPKVAIEVLDVMTGRLQAAHARLLLLSSAPVEKRIAVTLLQLANKLGKKREMGLLIDAPLSRNSLAEMTGSTPETASRVMSQLQAEGILRSGRQWVAIIDLDRLEKLALT